MLISSTFLSVGIIYIHSAISSEIPDDVRGNGRHSRQLQTETYRYNHPPLLETYGTSSKPKVPQVRGARKQKSFDINEDIPSLQNKTQVRGVRRRTRPDISSRSNLEIPVKVIYDSEPTTLRSTYRRTTNSQKENTGLNPNQRYRQQQANTNKNIDIRETKYSNKNSDREHLYVSMFSPPVSGKEGNEVSSVTQFPKRSRESFFRKRSGYQIPQPNVKIIEEKNFVYAHSGNFHYSFEGEDGTKVSSVGELKSLGNDKPGEAISGSVSYKDKDGNDVHLSYTADENGYRPVGTHLPTPPPVPPAIARALKYIAEKNKSTTPNGEQWFSADEN